MAKGFFTQGVTVLLARAIDVNALTGCLKDFEIARQVEPSDDGWMGGEGVVVAMRPDVNGYVLVDLIEQPWPDEMGDSERAAELFAAWSMGWFGPFVFPGNLERAQAMCFRWPEGKSIAAAHRAFVRIKSSYL